MSPELIGIMTVGVALAALQMVSIKSLREDMDKRFAALEQRSVSAPWSSAWRGSKE